MFEQLYECYQDEKSCFSDDMNWSIGTFNLESATAACQLMEHRLPNENTSPPRKKVKKSQVQKEPPNSGRLPLINDECNPSIPEYVECNVPSPFDSNDSLSGHLCASTALVERNDYDDEGFTLITHSVDESQTTSKAPLEDTSITATRAEPCPRIEKMEWTSQCQRSFSFQTLSEEMRVQMILAENRLLLERLRPCLLRSSLSHYALRQWDKKLGLPASHSRTMLASKRTRDLLQEGFDLGNL